MEMGKRWRLGEEKGEGWGPQGDVCDGAAGHWGAEDELRAGRLGSGSTHPYLGFAV